MMRVTKIGKQTGLQLCAKDERETGLCVYVYIFRSRLYPHMSAIENGLTKE